MVDFYPPFVFLYRTHRGTKNLLWQIRFSFDIFSSAKVSYTQIFFSTVVWIWSKLGKISPNWQRYCWKQSICLLWICASSASILLWLFGERKGVCGGFFVWFFKQTVVGKLLPTEVQLIRIPCQKLYIYEAPSFRAFRVWTLPIYPSNCISIQCYMLPVGYLFVSVVMHTASCLEVGLKIVLMTYIGRQHLIPDF